MGDAINLTMGMIPTGRRDRLPPLTIDQVQGLCWQLTFAHCEEHCFDRLASSGFKFQVSTKKNIDPAIGPTIIYESRARYCVFFPGCWIPKQFVIHRDDEHCETPSQPPRSVKSPNPSHRKWSAVARHPTRKKTSCSSMRPVAHRSNHHRSSPSICVQLMVRQDG